MWEGAWKLEAEKVGRQMAEDRVKLLEKRVLELQTAMRDLLSWHDGWHEEDCKAWGAGDDEDLPPDAADADPYCTCTRTEVRNQARAILSATLNESEEA